MNEKLPGFVRDQAAGDILSNWWDHLRSNPGVRAELRRCRTPGEVRLHPTFYALVSAMAKAGYKASRFRLSMMVGPLAHAKTDRNGAALGVMLQEAGLHAIRFKRLISLSYPEQLYMELIRVIKFLGGAVPLRRFADVAYWWNDRVKEELAYEFYLKGD